MDCSRLEGSRVMREKMEKADAYWVRWGGRDLALTLRALRTCPLAALRQTGVAVGIGSNSLESLERGKMSFGRINKGEG